MEAPPPLHGQNLDRCPLAGAEVGFSSVAWDQSVACLLSLPLRAGVGLRLGRTLEGP